MATIAESKTNIITERLMEFKDTLFTGEIVHDYFLNGKTGLSLFNFYLSKILDDQELNEQANALISEVLDHLGEPRRFYGGSFTLGLTGLTSALLIMKEEGFINFSDDDLFELDEIVYSWATNEFKIFNTDYLHGAAGTLNYFIERVGPAHDDCLVKASNLINSFYDLAIKDDQGFRFPNKFYKNRFPEFINLGVSHGMIGLLLIMIKAYQKGIEKKRCEEIITQGLKYLENQYFGKPFEQSGRSRFFVSVNEQTGEIQYTDRLAWCYGDLNVALVFAAAGQLFANQKYTNIGLEAGLETLYRQSPDQTEIRTPFFCHGTSGTAMVYKSLYRITKEEKFNAAYQYWRDKTFDMLDIDQIELMTTSPLSFLDGPMGLAFFLISEQSESALKWETFFLL